MQEVNFRGHNPDILDCIANLSNDEIFTPPKMANAMLDLLAEAWAADHDGQSIWENPDVKFLDPFTKSGVFLREITRRLTDGLVEIFPDRQERVNHILTQQVYGIAITELTGMLSRRSVYCSKWAKGEHSICREFSSDQGNIWFARTEHDWTGGVKEVRVRPITGAEEEVCVHRRCRFCGAGEDSYDRGEQLESHAYAFIHTDNVQQRLNEIFGGPMQFDVVIGNPPYQLSDGGFGKSAAPIYQEFVEQAKKLEPRYLSMIIPSRWFAGGKNLDEFRDSMLHDERVRSIDDYLNASDVFAGIGLKGGVCYFLWNRDVPGLCRVTTHFKDNEPNTAERPLLEDGSDVFIRFNQGVSILRKVLKREHSQAEYNSFGELVSSLRPFGFRTFFRGSEHSKNADDLILYQNGGKGYVPRSSVETGTDLIDCWKLFVGRAAPGTGNRDTYPHRIISTPFVGAPGEISSETYLCIAPFASKEEAESALSYLKCRFTRFLILLHKASQDTTRKVYKFVPMQTWDRIWTDAALYEKYGLTDAEIDFIESIVRPMEDQ